MPASSTAHDAISSLQGSYVPLALRPGWVLERFWGWSVLHEEASVKLLSRPIGLLTKYLLLAKDAAPARINELAARHGIFGVFTNVCLNDFSATVNDPCRTVAGRTLERADGAKWFGVGTFLLDLEEDEAGLHRRIAGKEWSKLRSPEQVSLRCDLIERPTGSDLDEFRRLYEPFARERGLEGFDRPVLERMADDDSLLLARCADGDGRTLVANLIYRAHAQGYFLASARAPGIPAGAGRLAHWETARKLKRDGCRFYDLGLVASRDPTDGIYQFKKSLGGAFVTSGSEFRWFSPVMKIPWSGARAARRRLRRLVFRYGG
jgi:hypothetical protein